MVVINGKVFKENSFEDAPGAVGYIYRRRNFCVIKDLDHKKVAKIDSRGQLLKATQVNGPYFEYSLEPVELIGDMPIDAQRKVGYSLMKWFDNIDGILYFKYM